MRKSKEGGIMWWSSVHHGLDQYYHELDRALTPFLTSYIKHHPINGWGLSQPCLSHLDYTIQPEQRLLRLSNKELLQHLHDLQRQWNVLSQQPRPSVYQPSHVVFEVDQRIQDPFNPITGPVETWSLNACARKLSPRRPAAQPDYYSDTEPETPAEDHEQTSDEEGIEPQKTCL
ncbi:hypothetical protein FE257_006701 [Aspergillus nanangensis]|uniref:Uncharacterized protein n=1 Tax=Aspergillus nanangensis TaxID=2582783 RepID=A0AAD4GUS3_ASPNN|nr:hypothetical protein FE257_006701 [Aspergillus nanangensis]